MNTPEDTGRLAESITIHTIEATPDQLEIDLSAAAETLAPSLAPLVNALPRYPYDAHGERIEVRVRMQRAPDDDDDETRFRRLTGLLYMLKLSEQGYLELLTLQWLQTHHETDPESVSPEELARRGFAVGVMQDYRGQVIDDGDSMTLSASVSVAMLTPDPDDDAEAQAA